jgi:hypothetical protein
MLSGTRALIGRMYFRRRSPRPPPLLAIKIYYIKIYISTGVVLGQRPCRDALKQTNKQTNLESSNVKNTPSDKPSCKELLPQLVTQHISYKLDRRTHNLLNQLISCCCVNLLRVSPIKYLMRV